MKNVVIPRIVRLSYPRGKMIQDFALAVDHDPRGESVKSALFDKAISRIKISVIAQLASFILQRRKLVAGNNYFYAEASSPFGAIADELDQRTNSPAHWTPWRHADQETPLCMKARIRAGGSVRGREHGDV